MLDQLARLFMENTADCEEDDEEAYIKLLDADPLMVGMMLLEELWTVMMEP